MKSSSFPAVFPTIFMLAAMLCQAALLPGRTETVQPMLKGHVPAATKKLASIDRLESTRHLNITIGLPLRNREALTNLLQGLYEPSSSNFRQFLTPDQFTSSFAPSEKDYQAVMDFAKAHGLIVKGSHANRTLLDVRGTVADIEQAFHIHLNVYQHPTERRTFFAPDREPSLDLNTPVLMISGLDSYVRPRPQIRPMIRTNGGGNGGGGGGGGGNYTGPFEGNDFRNAYAAGVSLNGAGQTLGLFELFSYSEQDIEDYEDEVGISPYVSVQPVLIDGASGDDTGVDWVDYPGYLDYSFEVTGDIETAIAMAPGLSSVLVYEGPTPQDVPPLGTNDVQDATTTAQINDVFNRMATDNLAKQLSCSYGFDINLSTVQIFQQFAAQGQSFFLASGDGGAFPAAIDEPADDPYLTVVGGTTLTTTSAGAWASETTWLSPPSSDGLGDNTPLEASGGGVSTVYAIPSWQQGISMTANQGSTTMRNLPDVAAVANNINIVWGNDFIGASSDFAEGGTSLAAPQWAGFMAMVNQQAAASGKAPVGLVNPALYAIGKSSGYASCFHDITTGANTNASSPAKYRATSGYDLCTGWGTLIGSNLIPALLAPPAESLRLNPPAGFTSSGPGGGPFSVASETYTLTNLGSAPLNWSVTSTSAWLTVFPVSGTLNPGGASATVNVSLNAATTNFLIAAYSGNVSFSNRTDHTYQNRQFDLYAGNGGFETADLRYWNLDGGTNLDFTLAGDDVDVAGTNALDGEADELFVHSGIYGAYLGEYPDTGSLSQTVATQPGQQYLVSFWLTTIPYQGETTPNYFAAKWNGLTLFAQSNLDAFGWTNLQYGVAATGASTTLEFDFSNVPGAFGLDDVTVEPAPAPVFQAYTLNHGVITLTWSTVPDLSYQIQSETNLLNPNWTNLSPPLTATGSLASVSEPVGAAPLRFYRVVLLPP